MALAEVDDSPMEEDTFDSQGTMDENGNIVETISAPEPQTEAQTETVTESVDEKPAKKRKKKES